MRSESIELINFYDEYNSTIDEITISLIEQSLIRQLDACMDVTAERRCILA